MSVRNPTSADALRQAITHTLVLSVEDLQERIGSVSVGISSDYTGLSVSEISAHDPESRSTVLLVDRISAGGEAQALARALVRWHGPEAAADAVGDQLDELLARPRIVAEYVQPSFESRLKTAVRICLEHAKTGNAESTRELCNCIEQRDGDRVMAELVKQAHQNPKLNQGVRLLFDVKIINDCAERFGVEPLPLNIASVVTTPGSGRTASQLAKIEELDAAIGAAQDKDDAAFFSAVAAKDAYVESLGATDRSPNQITQAVYLLTELSWSEDSQGEELPVAGLFRVTPKSLANIDQVTGLIEKGVLTAHGAYVAFPPEDVVWLSRVGFTGENTLASVPGFYDASKDRVLYLSGAADMEVDGERAEFQEVSEVFPTQEHFLGNSGLRVQKDHEFGLVVSMAGDLSDWDLRGFMGAWPKLRNEITAVHGIANQFPDSPLSGESKKFRVVGAHPNRNMFAIEVEAADGLSAFGEAALLLKEAGEDGEAEFYAAMPAGTDFELPGEGVVTLDTVLDPEQASVFGLAALEIGEEDHHSPRM